MEGITMRQLALVIVLIAATLASGVGTAFGGTNSKSIGGESFTANYDPATGAILFSITGNSSIKKVERAKGTGYQDITSADSRPNDAKEWRAIDTTLKDNADAHAHYKVTVTVNGVDHVVNVNVTGGGTVSFP
jgi:hypothetical protein